MGAYQRTIWPNGLPPLLRRAGDQRQYEALRAFYMDGLSSSVKVRGGTADPSGSSNRIANSPMLGQFRSVEIQASGFWATHRSKKAVPRRGLFSLAAAR